MDLYDYLSKNRIKYKDFAKKIGIGQNHLSSIINKKVKINLSTAMKIHKGTDKQVSFEDLAGIAKEKEVEKITLPKTSSLTELSAPPAGSLLFLERQMILEAEACASWEV